MQILEELRNEGVSGGRYDVAFLTLFFFFLISLVPCLLSPFLSHFLFFFYKIGQISFLSPFLSFLSLFIFSLLSSSFYLFSLSSSLFSISSIFFLSSIFPFFFFPVLSFYLFFSLFLSLFLSFLPLFSLFFSPILSVLSLFSLSFALSLFSLCFLFYF